MTTPRTGQQPVAAARAPHTVRVDRYRQAPRPGARCALWGYRYTRPVAESGLRMDGTPWSAPAGSGVDYGTLTGLRDFLRRHYGQDVQIIETWKQYQAGAA